MGQTIRHAELGDVSPQQAGELVSEVSSTDTVAAENLLKFFASLGLSADEIQKWKLGHDKMVEDAGREMHAVIREADHDDALAGVMAGFTPAGIDVMPGFDMAM